MFIFLRWSKYPQIFLLVDKFFNQIHVYIRYGLCSSKGIAILGSIVWVSPLDVGVEWGIPLAFLETVVRKVLKFFT